MLWRRAINSPTSLIDFRFVAERKESKAVEIWFSGQLFFLLPYVTKPQHKLRMLQELWFNSQANPLLSHNPLLVFPSQLGVSLQLSVQWAEFMRNAFSTCSFRSGLNSCCWSVLLVHSAHSESMLPLLLLSPELFHCSCYRSNRLPLFAKPVTTPNQDKVPLFLVLNC